MPSSNELLRVLAYAGAMALATALMLWLAFRSAETSMDASGVWLAWPLIFVGLILLIHLYLRKGSEAGYAAMLLVSALSAAILLVLVVLMVSPSAWPVSIIHLVVALIAGLVARSMLTRSAGKAPRPGFPQASNSASILPPPPQSDLDLDRLTRLKELHDSGVITDEQFASEKARILKR